VGKRLLFLQGPAGPFFRRVARRLTQRGCHVTKVNFNSGEDSLEGSYALRGETEQTFADLLASDWVARPA